MTATPATVVAPGSATTCGLCGGHHVPGAKCDTLGPLPTGPGAAAANAEDEQLLGKTVGNFVVVKKLASGGMGSVFLGEHAVIGSRVAVKFIHTHLARDPRLVDRFLVEARAVNLVGHENIVSVYDIGLLPPDRYYMVMELLEGEPLSALPRPSPPRVVVPILKQICAALEAAHGVGVIHRDLKLDNVFLVRRASSPHFVKLVDFGVAKLLSSSPEQTVAGAVVGTPLFMPPEQWSGAAVDGRSDLYALGVMAYALLTGNLPFSGQSLPEILHAHLNLTPVPPRQLVPGLPAELEEIVLKLLEKRPEDRFQKAADALAALEWCDVGPAEPREVTPGAPERTPSPRVPFGERTPGPRGMPTPVSPLQRGLAPLPTSPLSNERTPGPRRAPVPPVAPPTGPGRSTMALPREPARPPVPPAAPKPPPVPDFPGKARLPGEDGYRAVRIRDVSKHGVFVCTEPPFPGLMSLVSISLAHPGGELRFDGEVVRHVTREQASAWGMPVGFALQVTHAALDQRQVLERLAKGEAAPVAEKRPSSDDAEATKLLASYRRRASGDHYALLGVAEDADFGEIRRKFQSAVATLEAVAPRLSGIQRDEAEKVLERLHAAQMVLAHPTWRAAYDADRGNFKGIARCIAGGVKAEELDNLRAVFLRTRPEIPAGTHARIVSGDSLAMGGHLKEALEEFQFGLREDPLSIELQQRYWALRRRMNAAAPG